MSKEVNIEYCQGASNDKEVNLKYHQEVSYDKGVTLQYYQGVSPCKEVTLEYYRGASYVKEVNLALESHFVVKNNDENIMGGRMATQDGGKGWIQRSHA